MRAPRNDLLRLPPQRRMGTGNRYVVIVGCLQLLSFVVGYGWSAGWIAGTVPVAPSLGHCLLGGATLGVSAALGTWLLS